MYQDKHEYNVIKGVIPDFGYDVKFAIKVDGNKANEIPESQAKGSNGKFYKVEVNCDNNVDGEWDYNAWNVKLNGVVENSKCTLSFVSNMSNEERDNILKEGVTYRRNTYRGQDITKYKTGTKINGRDLYQQISDCTFDDIYVGDYILSDKTDVDGNEIKWLIADINNYLYTGDTELTKCHVTIIPEGIIKQSRMNATDTTEGGYLKSEMVTTTLPQILKDYVLKDFADSHVLTYRNILSTDINKTAINRYGISGGTSSNWDWDSRQIDLMSEVNVYGSIVVSSSTYDVGIDNRQYAIFKLRPELIIAKGKISGARHWYWLKAVTFSTNFAYVGSTGDANGNRNASIETGGVRPRFLID